MKFESKNFVFDVGPESPSPKDPNENRRGKKKNVDTIYKIPVPRFVVREAQMITYNAKRVIKNPEVRRTVRIVTVLAVCFGVIVGNFAFDVAERKLNPNSEHNKAQAHYQFSPTGGGLQTGAGAQVAASNTNTGGWRGVLGNDGNYWSTTNSNPGGLKKEVQFDGVNLLGGNKLILTIEDKYLTTATAFTHQICDWSSSTGVDVAAEGSCTGGGWRTLQPRKATYTTVADNTRNYEIYDGYFWTRSGASPGVVESTPLSNFVSADANKRVLMRVYSAVASTTQHDMDEVRLETAIDPYYEPAAFTKTAGGTTTNYVSDLIGPAFNGTNLTASDNNRLTIPMPSANNAIDARFTFKNVKTYTGMNTFLISPEINVSNTGLTVGVYLKKQTDSTWTQLGTNKTLTTADVDHAWSFNSNTIGSFVFADHISSGGEVEVRFLTNAPATAYNLVLDRMYMMVGSTNDNNANCEISWGTGTAGNCTNTKSINEGKTATPTTTTWQATSALEYPAPTGGFYGLNNDDDATNAEYATSNNLSFPITVSSGMAITASHYAVKFRSNSTALTLNPQIRDYSGVAGVSGWVDTPGADTNLATTYSYYDSWGLAEYQASPEDTVDTSNNLMNLRLRTTAGTTTNPGTNDWDFAMMSVRWVVAPNSPPTLLISQPDGVSDTVTVGQAYNITYDLADTDNVVTSAFYYDTNATGLDGTAITGACATAAEGSGATCSWDTTGMTPGNYYVYGITNDGVNPAVSAYSSGVITIQGASNQNPNSPSSLTQGVTESAWTTDNTPNLGFTISDNDAGDTVKYQVQVADNSSFTTPAIDYTHGSTVANPTAFTFTVGSYGSGTCTGSCPASLSDSATGYWWRVKAIDNNGASSSWVEFGVAGTMDMKVDATAPTGGTVKDGQTSGGDLDWNTDGSLTSLLANWTGTTPDSSASGLQKYEYALRRQPDGWYWSGSAWQAGESWTDNGTSTSFTKNSMNLRTGVIYYVSLKTTDNAGNIATINSNGLQVSPTLSFSLNSNTVDFSDLNNINNWTDTKSTIFTTSTNASNGYTIQGFMNQLLTSPYSTTIPSFSGTWATPQSWANFCKDDTNDCGFGYTSSDTSVQGSNRFSSGTLFAAFTQTGPGNVLADHTDLINGSTGAVSNEAFTLTHKVSVPTTQEASRYSGILTVVITANY